MGDARELLRRVIAYEQMSADPGWRRLVVEIHSFLSTPEGLDEDEAITGAVAEWWVHEARATTPRESSGNRFADKLNAAINGG